MFVMRRIVVFDHLGDFKHEITPAEVDEIKVVEEINGPHTITISSTRLHLTIGDTVMMPREHAVYESSQEGARIKCDLSSWTVYGIKSRHERSGAVRTEYTCIWSIQYDATGVYVDSTVGVTPCQESVNKLPSVWWAATLKDGYGSTAGGGISNNNNPAWELYLPVDAVASASFYNMDGWESVKRFLERWGGELDSWVRKYFPTGTDDRYFVSPTGRLGSEEPVMRLDYGWDVENVERTVKDGVWGCRVIPLGKSTQTEGGGYSRRPTIESVNNGVPWLEADSATVTAVRRKKTPPAANPTGSYYWYPTVFVKNDVYEDPADLKAWAQAHLAELTQPSVTYKVDALSLGDMGLDTSKLRLGDTVAVVDSEIVEGGMRLTTRVVRLEYSLLGENQPTKLTLGTESASITNALQATNGEVAVIREQMDLQQT